MVLHASIQHFIDVFHIVYFAMVRALRLDVQYALVLRNFACFRIQYPQVQEQLNEDGSVIVSLRLKRNYEFERLLPGFGEGLKVLAPGDLQRRVRKKLEDALQQYAEPKIDGTVKQGFPFLIILAKRYNTIMAGIKTKVSDDSVTDFINSFAVTDQRKKDSFELVSIMHEHTGYPPKMWGPSIIGFGSYEYKYESGHGGVMPLVGFSPRKSAISLYVYTGDKAHEQLLEGLGKFTMGKACIYVKKLSDIDIMQLKKLMNANIAWVEEKYGKS